MRQLGPYRGLEKGRGFKWIFIAILVFSVSLLGFIYPSTTFEDPKHVVRIVKLPKEKYTPQLPKFQGKVKEEKKDCGEEPPKVEPKKIPKKVKAKEKKRFKGKKEKITIYPSPFERKQLSLVVLHERAAKAMEKGDYGDALRLYNRILEIHPRDQKALLNQAVIYITIGDKKKAKELLSRLLSINPNNINALNNLGVLYMEEGDFSRAEGIFRRVLQLDPSNRIALINLGLVLKRMGRLDEAKEVFQKGYELYSKDYHFPLNLGIIYYTKGDMELAYYYFNDAFEKLPEKLRNSDIGFFLKKLVERY